MWNDANLGSKFSCSVQDSYCLWTSLVMSPAVPVLEKSAKQCLPVHVAVECSLTAEFIIYIHSF